MKMNIKTILANLKQTKTNKKKNKVDTKKIIISLIIVILVIGLYKFKNLFVIAMVNGKPISRLSLISEVEKQAGKQVLETLISKKLILQEAKKQKIKVTEEEIDQEIAKLEENINQQGQELLALLEMQGISLKQLAEEIKLQKIIDKIVSQEIEVSEEEINTYLEKNQEFLLDDSDIESVRENIKEQLKQQKISEKVQTWLTELREQAEISYF